MPCYLLSLTLLVAAVACTQQAPDKSTQPASEFSRCVSESATGERVLNRALFPVEDVGRIKAGEIVRFSAVGDSYSVWQTVSRLADTADERWVFVEDHADADILFVSLGGADRSVSDEMLGAIRSFGIAAEIQSQIAGRAVTATPNAISFFSRRRSNGSVDGKVILTREEHPYTNRVGMLSLASLAAIGGPADFEVLLTCRGALVPPRVLPPRPTEEARMLFRSMLRL